MTEKETIDLTKLEGSSNYPLWKFGITFVLESKDLSGHINGTEKEPDKTTKATEWVKWKKASSNTAVLLLSSVNKSLHANLMNCPTPAKMWEKLKDLYGEASEDAKEGAWEKFYTFRMSDGESLALQIEQLETIIRKLKDSGEAPSDSAVMSKLLSSLPSRYSPFRMAWECTPKAERTKDNLIARLIREDKRLEESEESVASLALQISALQLKISQSEANAVNSEKGKAGRQNIEELKKRTRCGYCQEKGHWHRECPKKAEEKKNSQGQQPNSAPNSAIKTASGYICDVSHALYSGNSEEDDTTIWLADSGASHHMTYKKNYFSTLETLKKSYSVKIADNKILPIAGIGTVVIKETVDGQQLQRELSDVLYVPGLRRNLFSITAINDKKFSFHAYEKKCEVRDSDGNLCSLGIRYDNLFKMLFEVQLSAQCNVTQANLQKENLLWHERMGHVNMHALINTSKVMNVNDLSIKKTDDFFCETCVMAKQTRKPHNIVQREEIFKPGEKIHSDVCGPVNVESLRGSRYFLLFKDECTGFRKVYFLRHKSEVFEKFKEFDVLVQNQTGNKVKVLRSDNGTEYTCGILQNYIKNRGIIHEFSSPYIHEQNGRAEREIRTITESARSMLIGKNVSAKLWPEAVNTAAYLLNRIVMRQGETKTPFEKWFGRKPEVRHLRVFGADAYLNIRKEKRNKFDSKSKKMILVGYDNDSTNYRLWDEQLRKIHISSDVDFNERDNNLYEQNEACESVNIEIDFGDNETVNQQIDEQQQALVNQQPHELENLALGEDSDNEGPQNDQPETAEAIQEGRLLRNRQKLQPPERFGVPVAFIAERVPMTYAEAMASDDSDKWQAAIKEEMQALDENNTWTLATLPAGKRAIGCKWVFAIKSNVNGDVRYKARLVAKGFSQREGIDYFETFAPVIRYESVRILLAIAARENYDIVKFDVKTAFLYGELSEEIFMQQPEGHINEDHKDLVYKLHRSLYGLKQSPRCWNKKFVSFLEKFSFKSIESDQCVFIGAIENSIVYLALYVDDGLLISENVSAINSVLMYLRENFQITTDVANEYIGLEIERDRAKRTLKISQSKYIEKLVDRFGMSDANTSSVPAEPGLYLCKSETSLKPDVPYREAIGALLFAARVCRPDIEYAVNYLSQFLESYNHEHWQAVKRIIRYLSGTRDFGIVYGNSGSIDALKGYTDADYAGCLETRRSRSGFVFLLYGGPISWSSQRQSVTSLSTAEAEYIALAHGTKEAIWLRRLLNDLKFSCTTIPLFVDNQSAIKLANNSEFHKRSKHIDVRYHFVRDIVNQNIIELNYVESKEQLADVFTKPLAKQAFCYLREKLNVLNHPN